MLKFIMKAFGPIKGKCNHKHERVQTIHGVLAAHLNARSLWVCNKCGKVELSKSLTEVKK